MTGQLAFLDPKRYRSNLTPRDFTIRVIAFMAATQRFASDDGVRPSGEPRCRQYHPDDIAETYQQAAKDAGWKTERIGCRRMCPRSRTGQLTPIGWALARVALAAPQDRAEAIGRVWSVAGRPDPLFEHMLKNGFLPMKADVEDLLATFEAAECPANLEWASRIGTGWLGDEVGA